MSRAALRAATLAVAVLIGVAATDLAVQLGRDAGSANAAPVQRHARPSAAKPVGVADARPLSAREALGLPPGPVSPRPAPRSGRLTPALAAASVAIPRQQVAAPVGICQIVDGALEPPSDVHRTCRWAGGADLGATQGTTVITGHINWVGQGTGALGNIGQLAPGNAVYTADEKGTVTRWHVQRVIFRNKNRGVDLHAFAGPAGPRVLYLVSCGGPFDAADASYVDNIYVRAVPAGVGTRAG